MGKGGIFRGDIELVLNTDYSDFGSLYDRGGLYIVALHMTERKNTTYVCTA